MIITRVVIGSLTDLVVNEATYKTATGFSADTISIYTYDGADWTDVDTSTVVNFTTLGITYTGTPTTGDEILIAFHPSEMQLFSAGDGINCIKLNTNFDQVMSDTNDNETQINDIASTALLANGSNLTQSIIDDFQKQEPIVLSTDGSISVTDNRTHFLTLTSNNDNKIILPAVSPDSYSHTIIVVVDGSSYSLDVALGTAGTLGKPLLLDSTIPYCVMYIYNKIDSNWYYVISQ